jgi:phosphatidylglycerol:prolipoprotein diacylglycerol transferase
MIHKGGMAFHGGAIGVTLGIWYFSRKSKRSLLEVGDFLVPLVPLGLALGRIGNFINGELWGRVTTVDFPFAMIFPGSDGLPRHPSQLYQASLEGIALFALLWWYSSKPRARGTTSALFLFGYGCARFTAEFFRQPDAHINYIIGNWGTMGHILSTPMIFGGLLLFLYCQAKYPLQKSN